MTLSTQIALTVTPLAAYFTTLGFLHGGRRARMIAGPVDVGLLAFGVSGLVGFGPIGQTVIGRISGQGAGLVPWSIWVGVLVVWAIVFAVTAVRRLAVYNVSSEDLDQALRDALNHLEGKFDPTIHGFEDSTRKTGLTVKVSGFLHAAGIEAYGRDPEHLIHELKPRLDHALKKIKVSNRRSPVSRLMFAAASLTVLVPIVGMMLVNPRTGQALRALLHSLRWW